MRRLDLRLENVVKDQHYLIYSDGLIAFGKCIGKKIQITVEYNLNINSLLSTYYVLYYDYEGIEHFSQHWIYYELTDDEVINNILLPTI